jgi:hypothetical protein
MLTDNDTDIAHLDFFDFGEFLCTWQTKQNTPISTEDAPCPC